MPAMLEAFWKTNAYIELMQKCLGDIRPPYSQRFISCLPKANWRLVINLIAVGIVLDHEATRIPPVIEEL